MLQQLNGAPVFVLGEGASGGRVDALLSETRATATYTGAANAGFILYSKLLGTAGNAITYTITTAADDNLAISVIGNAITIALANTTSSKNTATLVKAAIEAKAEANAIVAVVLTGTGAGVVATQAVASLTGGLNGTAGYHGQVVYDTTGNEWRMIWTNGAVYYWAPEGFPANDTEYVSHAESNTIVYKKKTAGTFGSSLLTSVAHGISLWGNMVRSFIRVNDSGVQTSGFISTTTFTAAGMDVANYRLYAGTLFYTKPYTAEFHYTKSI